MLFFKKNNYFFLNAKLFWTYYTFYTGKPILEIPDFHPNLYWTIYICKLHRYRWNARQIYNEALANCKIQKSTNKSSAYNMFSEPFQNEMPWRTQVTVLTPLTLARQKRSREEEQLKGS